MKGKSHISIYAEKAFDKFQHPVTKKKKTLNKVGRDGMCLNIIKVICDRLRANIRVNCGRLKPFHLQSGARQGCPFLLFFSTRYR